MKHLSNKYKPMFSYIPIVLIYFQMKDPRMKKYVSGFAVHWYGDSSSTGFLTSFLEKAHHQYPDKFILYTEASISKYDSCGFSQNAAYNTS
jgi:O-glycosyl hydrolase